MNSIVFGLLLAVCAFQVSNADMMSGIRNNINQAVNNLDSVINDMSRTHNNVEFNTQMQISNKKSDYMSQINGVVNPALSQIRTDVDAAKTEGKDAEHCYDTAKSSLRTVSQNGFSALNACEASAKDVLRQALSNLPTYQSSAESLKSQVNGILMSCFNTNQIQMVSCASIKLGSMQPEIRNLQSNSNNAKFTASSNANKAVLSMNTCGLNTMNTVRIGTTDARLANNNCVKS